MQSFRLVLFFPVIPCPLCKINQPFLGGSLRTINDITTRIAHGIPVASPATLTLFVGAPGCRPLSLAPLSFKQQGRKIL